MNVAPKNGEWVEVELTGGQIVRAHWAEDLSGEGQPPFRGWFTTSGNIMVRVHPLHWRKQKESQ